MKRRIKRLMIGLVAVYIAGGVVLYFIQDLLLFHPKAVDRNYQFNFNQPFEELNIAVGKENISMVKFSVPIKKGVVLFYHGNMNNVEHYAKYPSIFTRNGYEVWMIDYPGFGKTTGKRSEAIIYEQALLMYDLALKNIGSDSIIIYGKSIGTGIASYVAANRPFKKLILETPYYSVDALARNYFPVYPVVPMTKYSFPVYDFLQKVKAPTHFFHGTSDEVIPYKQVLKLKKEKPSINLTTIEGGKHNDLAGFEMYQKKMDSLLAE